MKAIDWVREGCGTEAPPGLALGAVSTDPAARDDLC